MKTLAKEFNAFNVKIKTYRILGADCTIHWDKAIWKAGTPSL